jgi:hypothetical protein
MGETQNWLTKKLHGQEKGFGGIGEPLFLVEGSSSSPVSTDHLVDLRKPFFEASFDPTQKSSYLVDPASSHMLVSKIKPCMSKYKQVCTVKLRMAH